VGFGGYPSVPTMLAAARLGRPTLIHEQNVVLGRANRLLAPRAHRIATGFAAVRGLRAADRDRAVYTGNPVRPAIGAIGTTPYSPPGETIELLVVGGSQGARIFGQTVSPALAQLPPELRSRLHIAQQSRQEDGVAVAEALATSGVGFEVKPFFDDMPARLQRAHLVIGRAGASTIAELAAAGRPAILVPYPHALDDHQTANAGEFANVGGGWVIPQSAFTPAVLAERLTALLANPAALAAAATAARGFARDDAAEHLAGLVQSLVHGGHGGALGGEPLERAA
jgi:UDP-N-acetylglucosamine--N-acetylmuramyl-(pentapeptide) pyrophosphoryl-undecaprenol N-acetylglucosamine transferase